MDVRRGPIGKNVCYCTHIMASLLIAWKVTVVGIEYNDATI